jgi:hypothetical protein
VSKKLKKSKKILLQNPLKLVYQFNTTHYRKCRMGAHEYRKHFCEAPGYTDGDGVPVKLIRKKFRINATIDTPTVCPDPLKTEESGSGRC